MEARYYYIQNTVNPQDPDPVGVWFPMDLEEVPANFTIWKCYTNEEPTGAQQGLNKAAFKAWLNQHGNPPSNDTP